MAYDSTRQRLVLFGGKNNSSDLSDTWLYGSLIPASAVSLGTACAGTNGLPVLTSNTPFLGNPNFLLDLLSARACAPCAFGLAAVTQSLSLGGGCTLYLQNPIVTLVNQTNASGFASISLNVPLDPSLRGGTLYAQAFVLDSNGGPLGLAVTAGRQLVVGD